MSLPESLVFPRVRTSEKIYNYWSFLILILLASQYSSILHFEGAFMGGTTSTPGPPSPGKHDGIDAPTSPTSGRAVATVVAFPDDEGDAAQPPATQQPIMLSESVHTTSNASGNRQCCGDHWFFTSDEQSFPILATCTVSAQGKPCGTVSAVFTGCTGIITL